MSLITKVKTNLATLSLFASNEQTERRVFVIPSFSILKYLEFKQYAVNFCFNDPLLQKKDPTASGKVDLQPDSLATPVPQGLMVDLLQIWML